MNLIENIEEFYKRFNKKGEPVNEDYKNEHFNVFTRDCCPLNSPYGRRTFYKVALVLDPGKLYYADKYFDINKPALQFSNPMTPYAWENEETKRKGWFCIFNEEFLQQGERSGSLQQSPFFKTGGTPVFFLNIREEERIAGIFKNMVEEMATDYVHKNDALRSHLHLLMHEAIKLQPSENLEHSTNAGIRVTSLFLELLDRQFPIEPSEILQLKSAQDYANQLSIHVNSLNRAVKQSTGKTTTEHITTRIIQEATSLLQHTHLNITEIAYLLGFEEPNNFTSFFKKHTDKIPSSFRKRAV